MQPWWLAFPGRVEYEYACLDAAGVQYVQDEQASDRGFLQLIVSSIGGKDVELVLTFPDLYPFFRPAVRMADPAGAFDHHRQPFSGDLCLLGRKTAQWSTADTAAWLLTTQLPKTLDLGALTAEQAESADLSDEDPQAEPFAEYYTCFAEEAMLLVDGGWTLPDDADSGELGIGLSHMSPYVDGGTLGAVLAVTADDGRQLAALDGVHPARFPHTIKGRWQRLDAPVHLDDPESIWAHVRDLRPDLPEAPRQGLPNGQPPGATVSVTGLVFPQERSQRQLGDGWMFIVRIRRPGPAGQPRSGKHNRRQAPTGPTSTMALVRAGYAGRSDLTGRMPELEGLAGRHVLILGLGAIGSSVAEQLARAGVGRLTLVDRDIVEPGNLVRHAAELRHVGWMKAKAVADVSHAAGLYTEIVLHDFSIGGVRWQEPPVGVDDRTQQDALAELVDAADIVVDSTAEKAVGQTLAWLCAKRAKPLIIASATNGGWGGRVSAFVPHSGNGCWSCLEHSLDDGSVPAAPAAPETVGVQPVGCAEPTFTGIGFDLAEVSLHAVRVSSGLLQADVRDGYPAQQQPVALLALRDADGQAIPPSWSSYPLPIHPACTAAHDRG
jgi:molybdopterin/thiamine biosynthesis adenylyltransferase